MNVETYIAAVQARIAARAIDACTSPKGRDAFEYGERCGNVQGLQEALQILNEQLNPKDDSARGRNSRPTGPVNPYTADLDAAPNLPEQYGRR